MEEGICGRFGRIGVWTFAYRPGSFGDDLGESFTVCGFLFLMEREHMKRKSPVSARMQADVRRFDVKDRAKALST